MQLILDAEDIDIKRNMSTIEHESLNEKFLANKIIEHLADDICSGNKENIQKQNNVISKQAEDVDPDKENSSKNDIISKTLNGDNVEDIETDNVDKSEKVIEIESKCNEVIKNVNEEICQADKNELILEEAGKDTTEQSEKENKLNLTTEDKDADDAVNTTVKNVDGLVILDNDDANNESSATKDVNSIILNNSADENESSVEIEADDLIVIDYNASNACNDGSSIKEADIVIPDNAEENEPSKLNGTNSFVTINNVANKEITKEIYSFLIPDNNAASAVKEAVNTQSIDDAAVDECSSTEKVTDSAEKTKPVNVKGNKMDDISAKTMDNGLVQGPIQNKASNSQSCNHNKMDGTDKSNSTIEIEDEDVKMNEGNSESVTKIRERVDMKIQAKEKIIVDECKNAEKELTLSQVASEPKRICTLSNNLDIFSDEEEEENSPNPTEEEPLKNNSEKESISIEDDDEIMVIDEVSNVKDSNLNVDSKIGGDKIEPLPVTTVTNEEVRTEISQDSKAVDDNSASETVTSAAHEATKVAVEKPDSESSKSADKVEEIQQKVKKPLLPKNFVRSYKKNLADMTREELEEFCILKIVESIVDRSNLGEIKLQLKNLTQTMEECKKKCLMLAKQNKDLHVVLKSVQEEQKSASDVHITPLKITRSVGMQVVMMVDKNNMRKKTANDSFPVPGAANPANNKAAKSPLPSANTKSERKSSNPQIPVPRLVPAVPAAKTNQIPSQKQVSNSPIPNGLRVVTPVPKAAEKRSRSQSITVDLTDDEPPAKQQTVQRNIVNQGVRMGTPQPGNLLTAQRFGQSINSPRKVYIPISGQAQNVRPGQAIMLKPVPGLHPRPRCPSTHPAKVSQAASNARLGRILPHRHPAPLPEAPKQYQPPNWKTLPPPPDLKLSKVENGIVISWKIDNYHEDNHEVIASYQLYAYQETQSPPSTSLWKKIGDVKALPLPMACTLTQFMAGYKYYFAVRAVDVRSRFGPFSLPGSILLLNKM